MATRVHDPQHLPQVEEEIRLMEKLRHVNIVQFVEVRATPHHTPGRGGHEMFRACILKHFPSKTMLALWRGAKIEGPGFGGITAERS